MRINYKPPNRRVGHYYECEKCNVISTNENIDWDVSKDKIKGSGYCTNCQEWSIFKTFDLEMCRSWERLMKIGYFGNKG